MVRSFSNPEKCPVFHCRSIVCSKPVSSATVTFFAPRSRHIRTSAAQDAGLAVKGKECAEFRAGLITTDCPACSQSIPPLSSTTRRIAASALAGSAFSATAAVPFLPVRPLVELIAASWPASTIREVH